jgi:hypothetical protein
MSDSWMLLLLILAACGDDCQPSAPLDAAKGSPTRDASSRP